MGVKTPPHPHTPSYAQFGTFNLTCPQFGGASTPTPPILLPFFSFNTKRYQIISKQSKQIYEFIQTYSFTFLAYNVLKVDWRHVRPKVPNVTYLGVWGCFHPHQFT